MTDKTTADKRDDRRQELLRRKQQVRDGASRRDQIIRSCNAEHKDEAFRTSRDMLGNFKGFVSTGIPPLDVILGGEVGRGFALGRASELLGEADVGKTTLGCCLLRNIQTQGGLGVVIDTEKTLTESRLTDLGVDPHRLIVVEDNIIESICDRILTLVGKLDDQPAVIFWDTIASTRSRRDKGRKIGEGVRIGNHAQILSEAFRQIAEPLSKSRTALVMCNQRKEGAIGQLYVSKRKRDATLGGDAVKFLPSQRLKLSFSGDEKDKGKEKGPAHYRFIVSASNLKNKVSPTQMQARMVMTVTGDVSHFDAPESYVETMVRWGEFGEGKILMTDPDGGKKYGRASFLKAYRDDPGFRKRMFYVMEEAHRKLNLREG